MEFDLYIQHFPFSFHSFKIKYFSDETLNNSCIDIWECVCVCVCVRARTRARVFVFQIEQEFNNCQWKKTEDLVINIFHSVKIKPSNKKKKEKQITRKLDWRQMIKYQFSILLFKNMLFFFLISDFEAKYAN